MCAEALQACENAWNFSGGNTEALSIAGYIQAVAGDKTKAESQVQEMLQRKKERYVPPYNLALVFAGLGQPSPHNIGFSKLLKTAMDQLL